MKSWSYVTAAVVLVLVAGSTSAQGVYKCTGPDGAVSFQDRPCSGSAEQQTVRVGKQARTTPTGYKGKAIPLPGGAEAAIMVFDYVDATVSEDGERATTVTLQSKRGAPARMNMMLTFMPNKRGEMLSREQRERAVRRIAAQRVGRNLSEQQMVEFEARSGAGLVAVFDNRQQALAAVAASDYPILTAGLIASDRYVVAMTILTDGDNDKVLSDAISVAKTLFIASDFVATNEASGELALPEPPAGYSWERAPRIKGALLRPEGWHFDTQHEGDDRAYFISREPHVEPDGYDTGLSLNVQTNVPGKTGMSASAYAAAFIRTAQGELETLEAPFTEQSGPFVSHGGLFGATDPERGDFIAFMFTIANDVTGTVYLLVFEGPEDEWETLRPIGDTMIQKLLINDSI